MNRLATALIVLAVVAGPPLIAGLWLSEHLEQTPDLTSIQQWLHRPRTVTDLIYATMVVGFVLWLLLVAHLVRRVSVRLRRIPIPTPAQVTVSSMAGVVALTLPSTTVGQEADGHVTTSTPPADPNAHTTNAPAPTTDAVPGIALPGGGWIPSHTAAAVAALTTAIWLHRRRGYRPDLTRISTHHSDPDLAPLPPAAHALVNVQASQPAPTDTVAPEQLPPGVLRLHGPGAAAAARGLILTTALTHTATPNLASLAIPDQHSNPVLPGFDVAALADIGITFLPDASERGSSADTSPPTTTVVLIDDTETGETSWYVATDGTVTGPRNTAPRRLCVLDTQTAADLLHLALIHRQKSPAPPPLTTPDPAPPHHRAKTSPAGRLSLFGDCRLTVHDEHVRLRRSAGLQVLAYLAVHPEGATRAELIGSVWPNLPPSSITQRLHTTLSDLRRQLQPALESPVLRNGDRYRLNPEMVDTDLLEWRTLASEARQAISDVARADACRKMLDLYRGDLAERQAWPWIEATREEVRRDALDACRHLADQADPTEAVTWLRRALAVDPYNAAVQGELAQVLAGPGRRQMDRS